MIRGGIGQGFPFRDAITQRSGMIPARLLAIARVQHGALARRQLLDDVRMSASSVSRACSDGRLIRTGSGMYRLATHGDSFEHRCWSATLFGGEVGFVSGTSAGRLHGLRRMNPTIVEYTVPEEFRRVAPDWMRLRFTNWYDADAHRTMMNGVAVATPLRMLFGIAARSTQYRFDLAADDAWDRGLIDPESAARFLSECRTRGKNGVRCFERWLERVATQRAPSQSYLERDLIAAVERIGLPTPERQYPLTLRNGELIHLDLAWPSIRLGVEPGHSYFHGIGGGQYRDHRRDAGCAEIGWQILRLNEQMLTDMLGAARLVAQVHRQRESDVRTG